MDGRDLIRDAIIGDFKEAAAALLTVAHAGEEGEEAFDVVGRKQGRRSNGHAERRCA